MKYAQGADRRKRVTEHLMCVVFGEKMNFMSGGANDGKVDSIVF